MSAINNRYEIVYFFDVKNGNPNGDPDAGNFPRLDPETNHGLVTDVCLKRKIRNYVGLTKLGEERYNIYVKEKALLNQLHEEAYEKLGLKEEKDSKIIWKIKEEDKAKNWMCQNYFDIRTFGAVMSTGEKDGAKCGQVRGPVQFAFASSLDPIVPMEISITRMAVTNEKDEEKGRTMGRKHIVPYALYCVHGYVSAKIAEQTGFSEEDLDLLWESLENMFEHDHSAARGEMSARKLFVFKHNSPIGNAPAHKLFESIKVELEDKERSPRSFSDYEFSLEDAPSGVERMDLL